MKPFRQLRSALASSGSQAAHTALGYVLARDNLDQARRELLSGDKDALLLLALTYDTGVAAPPNLAWLQSSDRLPAEVEKRLESTTHRGPSLIAAEYYTTQLRRAAPKTTLIPGDWTDLVSPRFTLEEAIVQAFN